VSGVLAVMVTFLVVSVHEEMPERTKKKQQNGRLNLTAVQHTHVTHVPVVHLHVVIHRFGLGNLA
jgi:hypothetical protein